MCLEEILVVNFALVPHPHEIVCIHLFRTANTCIYSNPCFFSDEMNILLYFERNFLSCFYQFTSLTALFSCGIHLAEFVFLLTKENLIWNQNLEENWQPNVWSFCFKNTGATNKRNFFSILSEDEWIMICSILLQTKQIDQQWFLQLFFLQLFFCNRLINGCNKWILQVF